MPASRKRLAACALVLGVVLSATSPARAGGDFVDIAVGAGRVWFAGGGTVRSYDAGSGQQLSMPHLIGTPYPLSLALTPGASWVASVENGYVRGMLSRIDQRTGRVRVVWRRDRSSVQYVDVGAGSVWALIGSSDGGKTRIARFAVDGRLEHTWTIADAGRMAADGSGCWVAASGWLFQIDPAGRLHRVVRSGWSSVATGGGAVWLARGSSILRVDERSRRTRTLVTGRLVLGGFQHDLAIGAGAIWALQHGLGARPSSRLSRIDPRTGRTTRSVPVPGIADAVLVRPDGVWVASVLSPRGGAASGQEIVRHDARTLRPTLTIRVS
jgi:hypothetical protein